VTGLSVDQARYFQVTGLSVDHARYSQVHD
jgi:hypothetical protein